MLSSLLNCLIFIIFVKICICIKIHNGGYEDIYIFVREGVEENDNLVKRLKDVFTDASRFLFSATRNRVYFKKIRIVVPKTWSKKSEYLNVPAPALSKQYIIVDDETNGITTPHVRHTGTCGSEGIYMFLSSTEFILKTERTSWGSHDHVIVHEWGHLRWGVFDEYPTASEKFYQEKGQWLPVSCTSQITGKIGTGRYCTGNNGNECDITNTGKKLGTQCRFCPEQPKQSSSSLLGLAYLDPITHFCDRNDATINEDQRHNKHAPNRHNIRCNYKSVWEVLRKHTDFKDNTILSPTTNTVPDFEIIQSSEEIHRVFVLDVSLSMEGEKLVTLRQTCEYVIQNVIPQGSWLGIVTFSSSASTIKHVTKVNSQSDRDSVKAALPLKVAGTTCIGCGIEEAIEILKLNLESVENTELVLISDGENNAGNIMSSIEKAVLEKVIVNTIAVSQQADRLLADIAQDTGGQHYTYLEKGSISFAASFSESIKGDLTSTTSQPETLVSEKIDSTESSTLKFEFAIEDGIGANTTVTVISRSFQSMHIELSGPNEFIKSLIINGTQADMYIDGVAEAGLYSLTISMSGNNQTIEYYVRSTPTNPDVIKITSELSASKNNITSGDFPIAYVDVTKGYSPLLNASVTGHVESNNKRCTISLLDSGIDPDALKNDGVYSGYIFPRCLDAGRVNVKIHVSGEKGMTKISKKVTGAPSIIEENAVEPEVFNASFQRVQIMQELFIDEYSDTDTDIVSPGRITDVNIYHIVKETTAYGENRNFTISWTATGDDKNQGQASSYIMRISDDFDTLLYNFDSAVILNITNTTGFIPQESGQTEALKFVVDAEKSFTDTTFFAIQAVDDAGNRGEVSNVVSIVIAKGYRLKAELGTLDIESEVEVVKKDDNDNIAVIISGTIAGAMLIIACILIYLFCRHMKSKAQRKTQRQYIA